MQTDKDRLIELLKKADNNASKKLIMDYDDAIADNADYLLANGVIVPPCKFGDMIFVIPSKVNYGLNILHNRKQNNRVYEQVIDHITIWQDDYMLYTCDGLYAVRSKAYKDNWFLTREEAEEKLREYEDNAD